VLEFPVSAVRWRTTTATRLKQVDSATAMIWKVFQFMEKIFRQLNAPELLPVMYGGAKHADGIKQSPVNYLEVAP
jgi:hypothetical protein